MKRLALFIFIFATINVEAQHKNITLPLIWASREFVPATIQEMRSLKDGKTYTILENNCIVKYSYLQRTPIDTLVNGNKISTQLGIKLEIQDYQFSSDEQLVLIATNIQYIYRYSYTAQYYVYWLQTGKIEPLSTRGAQRLADISPTGTHVAFVRDNNLFLVHLASMTEQQITIDGEKNKIIYGAPDWVYEEEFGFHKGFHWSPDGQKILYYRFDETHVKEYSLFYYSGKEYPDIYTFKYPKAGEDNSIVELYVYDLPSKNHIKVDVGNETDQYIPRIGWTRNNNTFWFILLNRYQNHLKFFLGDALSGGSTVIYEETNPYFINITDNIYFLKDGKHYIWTSEKDGYHHIYLHSLDGKKIQQITSGTWDIGSIVFVDEKNKWIYYTSYEHGPTNLMLYRIGFDGKNKTLLFKQVGHYHATFSADGSFFILNYSNAQTPPQYAIYDNKLKKIYDLESNQTLIRKTREYGFVPKEFFSFTTGEGIQLNGWMMRPSHLESGKKYPVLMYVYGGPNSQTVQNRWERFDFVWFQMLVQKGFIVVSVDGRGTGGRGQEFQKCTYLQLGKLETIDQIETVKYLRQLPYVDENRIGIFGWSYGGYLSLLCMTRGAEYFAAGIAVAPVTNWRYYDNIYTERYMRKPQENERGYDENSPIAYVRQLQNPLLIIHGDADDNVHVQNTMEFINALVDANKPFEMLIYPNRNHGIYGGYTRLHLYTKMTDFLEKHLLK